MFLSLNLQGYISPDARRVLGVPVYFESLAAIAQPGALFDPAANLSLLPVALHAVVISLLNKAFRTVAQALTDFENHRTQRSHDDSLIIKRFVFEAFDCYVALFYIAFELQDIERLRLELLSLFSTDTARRVLTESVLPLAMQWFSHWHARPASLASLAAPSCARDLELEEYDDFDDYLEMVIQFGYITLFASAFPAASAIAFACNLVEFYSDLFKVSFLCRRARELRTAHGIGMWRHLLYVLMVASIFTNAVLFAFASDQMAMLLPSLFSEQRSGWLRLPTHAHEQHGELVVAAGKGRFVVLVLGGVEHALLLLLLCTEFLVPRAPGWVTLTLARRSYEEKEARREQRFTQAGR